MNKLLNLLVFLNVLSLYFCANITFQATKINKDLDLNCPYSFDKNESFTEFSYLRDGKVFYNYNKLNENNPNITQLPGNFSAIKSGSGHILFKNVNSTINGNFQCNLTFLNALNVNTSITRQLIIRINDAASNLNATLDISPKTIPKNNTIEVKCSSQFPANTYTLSELSIMKDSRVFVTLDSNNNIKWYNVSGVYLDETSDQKIPRLEFKLNATKDTKGDYQCQILYRVGTDSFDTKILSSSVKVNSAISISNNLVLYLSTFAIIISYLY